MPTDVRTQELLDAQVEWVLGELSGERLLEAIERDVADILAMLDRLVVGETVAREDVKAVAHRWVAMVGDSAPIELLATEIADAVYTLAAADDHGLGEVIGRDHVEALVARVLRM